MINTIPDVLDELAEQLSYMSNSALTAYQTTVLEMSNTFPASARQVLPDDAPADQLNQQGQRQATHDVLRRINDEILHRNQYLLNPDVRGRLDAYLQLLSTARLHTGLYHRQQR